MFSVNPYETEDYKTVCEWWKAWGWDCIPEMFLPPDGIVVWHGDQPICAVFLYQTNTPVMWAENYISTKDASKEVRQEAIKLMIDKVSEVAKNMGFKMVMSSINHPLLGKKLEDAGFLVGDKNMTNYAKVI